MPEIIEIDDSSDWENTPPPPTMAPDPHPASASPLLAPATPALFTEQDCLTRVLEIFSDVAHDHVRQEYRNSTREGIPGEVCYEQLVDRLIGTSYPKEKDKKRKREVDDDADDVRRWEAADDLEHDAAYYRAAGSLLTNEFRSVPVAFVHRTLQTEKSVYRTYLALEEMERNYDSSSIRPYTRTRGPRNSRNTVATEQLLKELASAKRKRTQENQKRQIEAQKLLFEAQNEQLARDSGTTIECALCSDDMPINRTVECDAGLGHFFCYSCVRSWAAEKIPNFVWPSCMTVLEDGTPCCAKLPEQLLKECLEAEQFALFEKNMTAEFIRMAGLEGLESCPFCEYQAICPPKEQDKEFRCNSDDCGKVSCRYCQLETHIPLSCEENAKQNRLSVRHAMEEAMTSAVVRKCNKCKNPFFKDTDGQSCNKMTCVRCSNIQCYICSRTLTNGYNHFSNEPGGCPLFDDTVARHKTEAEKAEAEARAKIQAENPDLTEEDLKIKVSERVARAEEQKRREFAQRVPAGYGPRVNDWGPVLHAAGLGDAPNPLDFAIPIPPRRGARPPGIDGPARPLGGLNDMGQPMFHINRGLGHGPLGILPEGPGIDWNQQLEEQMQRMREIQGHVNGLLERIPGQYGPVQPFPNFQPGPAMNFAPVPGMANPFPAPQNNQPANGPRNRFPPPQNGLAPPQNGLAPPREGLAYPLPPRPRPWMDRLAALEMGDLPRVRMDGLPGPLRNLPRVPRAVFRPQPRADPAVQADHANHARNVREDLQRLRAGADEMRRLRDPL